MERKIFLCLALLFLFTYCASATHFRGGTVSWKHISGNDTSDIVEISYRFGWRRNWIYVQCDDSAISNQTSVYQHNLGSWSIDTQYEVANNSYSFLPTSIICTAYDSVENWAYGYNSYRISVARNDRFSVSFVGGGWIAGMLSSLSRGSSWSVPALIDLGKRSDTGTVNRPPTTFSLPIKRLHLGCPSSMKINFVDEDGDSVTCRYAGINNTALSNECGGICNSGYQHFSLDQSTCTIHYDGGGGPYLIPIALMLEDHPQTTITVNGSGIVTPSDALSQIPLQFIVHISSTGACNALPTYPPYSIQENATIRVSGVGGSLDRLLFAFPSNSSARIIQFVVIGPLGAQVSSNINYLSTGVSSARLTWAPVAGQAGTHILCYYAIDSVGKIGDQICFKVFVTVSATWNPCGFDNGGCNDICVPQGPVRTCKCSNSCWKLLEDSETCVPPMNVTCDGERMEMFVPSCASNSTIVVGSPDRDVRKPYCQSTRNGDGYTLNINRQQCGLTEWSNPVALQYSAKVWIWAEKETTNSVITRGEFKGIPVTCSISTESEILNGSFVPQLPYDDDFLPNTVFIDGMGEYSFYFEFYSTSNYRTAIPPAAYPIQVEVNDRMYFSLGAGGARGLVFFTEECTATSSSPDGLSTLEYKFIANGCLLDSTLVRYPTNSPMEDRLSMEAFEFQSKLLSDRDSAEITIQCLVRVCDASNTTTRCFQGCLDQQGRRKRSVQSFSPDGSNQRAVDQAEGGGDGEEDDNVPSIPESLQKTKTRMLLKASSGSSAFPLAKVSYWALSLAAQVILTVLM